MKSQTKKFIPHLIILLAFFLQMQYLVELQNAFPHRFGQQPFCGVDAIAHTERAAGLLDGSLPGDNTYYFIPLYPLYLAFLKSYVGDSLILPVLAQALLQVVGIAALYSIGRLVYSPLTGALAAFGLATYNYYIFYLPCYDQALLTVPLLTVGVFFLLKWHREQKSGQLLAAGMALAVAALSRPTILTIFPVVVIWLFYNYQYSKTASLPITNTQRAPRYQLPTCGNYQLPITKKLWPFTRQIALLILPFIILVFPITWHNYRVSGRFILVSDNFGVNLFTGNNPDAAGLDTLAHIQGQPAELRFRETVKREESGQTTLAVEALRYIVEQPGDWLELMAAKTWLWFGEVDERLVSPFFPLAVSQSKTLARLPLEWQAMTIVALSGILLVPGRSRQQMVLLWLVYGALSVMTILFFVQLRFRLPFVPFVLLVAASLLASAPHWGRPQRGRQGVKRFWPVLGIMLILYPFVPSLWLFIVLFVGLSLIQNSKFKIQNSQISMAVGVGLYLVTIGWWVRANALASDVAQTIDHYLGPPLAGSSILGQTFQMDCDGLYRIDVTLGVLNTPHNEPVTFYLASAASGQEIIFSETFDGSLVSDYQKKSFTFSPIPDSAGQIYFFFLASPSSAPQNGITARGYTDTPVDRYPAGSAWAGQLGALQQLQADFAFTAYCDLTFWEKLWLALVG